MQKFKFFDRFLASAMLASGTAFNLLNKFKFFGRFLASAMLASGTAFSLLKTFKFTVFHVEKPMRGDVQVAVAVLLQRGIISRKSLSPCKSSRVLRATNYLTNFAVRFVPLAEAVRRT